MGDLGCAGPRPAFPRTRAYVKVQDGCSFTCSYCVIPQVRGPSRSRAAADVLADVARRARQGHREVVLTGINLGCFRDRRGGDAPARPARRARPGVDGIERVRLSSIEVNHVSDALLGAMAHPGVARHLHVPMQSGDDGVLAAMRRRYTAARFLRASGRARELVPGVNLTTDVIVGHPAEDDAAFGRTLAAVRAAGFTRVHVFPYSPRPGTADAASDPVPAAVKAERSRRLRELAERQAAAHRRALRAPASTCSSRRRPGAGTPTTTRRSSSRAGGRARSWRWSRDRPREVRADGGDARGRPQPGRRAPPHPVGAPARREVGAGGRVLGSGRRGGAAARAKAAAGGRRELPRRRAEDRAAAELADVPVIEEFLPAAMSEAELAALVDAAVAETGAESMRDMGRVMGLVTARGEGRVDGAAAAALVRARLGA